MTTKLNGAAKWILVIVAVISLFLLGGDRFIRIGELKADVVQNTKDNASQEKSISQLKIDVGIIMDTTGGTAKEIKGLRDDVRKLLDR